MTSNPQRGRYGVAPPSPSASLKVPASQRAALILDTLNRHPTVQTTQLAQALGVHPMTVRNDLAQLQKREVKSAADRPGRAQRLDALLALLSTGTEVTTRELSERLGVHDVTVRRDLEHLAHLGFICRDGPYVTRIRSVPERPFARRRTWQAAAKAELAARALAYVPSGARIGLDASTTALELARCLRDPTLSVSTTGLDAAVLLAERGIPVQLLGGTVNAEHRCLDTTSRLTAHLALDVAFFSCAACSGAQGYREVRAEEARSTQALLERSTSRVALLDQTKLGVWAAYPVAHPEDVDVLLSNAPAERLMGLATRRSDVSRTNRPAL
ncbi:DeoR family transcriptional regulator [Deinococcus sp. QL22]|uniref:DeoR family transcriptional regulator n=1 Tax=Deinococcus sp. QL22 TaxID=2939437 RepID=UPI002016F520|nr:DeoR family transcriptional regulator [Deinococcus sp. QL22]UQN09157.1 DeoR family transcriptional regulator [Deinococcus sp. QL22]